MSKSNWHIAAAVIFGLLLVNFPTVGQGTRAEEFWDGLYDYYYYDHYCPYLYYPFYGYYYYDYYYPYLEDDYYDYYYPYLEEDVEEDDFLSLLLPSLLKLLLPLEELTLPLFLLDLLRLLL